MPSRDPKTGKPVGGAAKARRRKAQAEAERKRKPAAVSQVQVSPPPESTAELVTWSAGVLAALVYRASQDRTIFLTELDQLRFLADTCAKIGLVRDKAVEQDRLRRLAEAAGKLPSSKPAGAKPLAGVSKPDTARRA